jgi:hypothetical protein
MRKIILLKKGCGEKAMDNILATEWKIKSAL